MAYRSTKTYGHDLGLSACFRQWRAESHCRMLHGYALAFTLVFEADELDANNWVMDFGSLKPIKEFLVKTFDHRMLVANDDPEGEVLSALEPNWKSTGVANVLFVPATGCEAFSRYVGEHVIAWLEGTPQAGRVRLVSVECREHGANSAIWIA